MNKQRKIIFATLFLLSVVSVVYLYIQTTKKDTKIKTPLIVRNDLPRVDRVVLSPHLQMPVVPSSLKVYSASTVESSVFTQADQIAAYLGLSRKDLPVPVWANQDFSATLTLSSPTNLLIYKKEIFLPPILPNSLGVERALAISKAFLAEINIDQELTPLVQEAKYYSRGGVEIHESVSENYDLIEIPFSQTVDSFPIYIGSSHLPFVTVAVDSTEEVFRAVFSPNIVEVNAEISAHSPIKINQLQQFLIEKNFQVIDAYSKTLEDIPSSVSSLVIDGIKLQYRLNEQTGILFPYFLLTDSTSPFNLSIVVPAI